MKSLPGETVEDCLAGGKCFLAAARHDDGIAFRFPDSDSPPDAEDLLLDPEDVEALLLEHLGGGDEELLWREAACALMLAAYNGKDSCVARLLAAPVRGISRFAEVFSSRGPRDRQGRAGVVQLRHADLLERGPIGVLQPPELQRHQRAQHPDERDGEQVISRLISFANESGGKDNITAVVVEVRKPR